MRFPHDVTIVRPQRSDEYGNPGTSFVNPDREQAKGFLATPTTLLMPADTVVSSGDRVEALGDEYLVEEAIPVRSPSRLILWRLNIEKRPG